MNQNEIKEKLREYIRQELLNRPTYPLDDDEALVTGGLIDSFSLARVGVFIEDAFGVYIPDTDLSVDNMDTVNQMTACILSESRQ
jgi:acyl carrier protein